jgi:hypothetical protein
MMRSVYCTVDMDKSAEDNALGNISTYDGYSVLVVIKIERQ